VAFNYRLSSTKRQPAREIGKRIMSEDDKILIRQIEEEVRRERYLKLWQQYGMYVVGGVALLVAFFGGWQWYTAYQLNRAQTAGAQFSEALERLQGDKKEDGLKGLEQIASEGSPAYAVLAKLRLAGEHREAGETDKALALYEEVAKDSGVDRYLSSFAELQIASLKVDSASWTDVENRLKLLLEDDAPWRFSARELLGLAAFKHGKWSEARDAYSALLTGEGVPGALRQRAQLALALITREEEAAAGGGGSDTDEKKKDGADAGTTNDLKKAKSGGDGAGDAPKSANEAEADATKTDGAKATGAQ
jgi:hypothetical protein